MDIRVFDKTLTALGLVDEMAACIWTIRYFSVGEIKILAPLTENNRAMLKVGNIVIKHDEYIDYIDENDNTWRSAAELSYVKYGRDEKGQEQIEARGYMLSKWLNQRVITPQIQMTGTCQQVVNELIRRNIRTGAAASRRFPQFSVLAQQTISGTSFEYSNEALKALGDEVRDVCQQGKLGYDILVSERQQLYGFRLYQGANLTSGNSDGNAPCIFSRDFDNVNSQEYEDSTDNMKNYAYIRGASDSNNNQEVVTVDGAGETGYGLREVFIDASDISRNAETSTGESREIPVATYRLMLKSRGETELAGMIENYTFNSDINILSNLKYKKDFDLGDRVTCIERRWGITINSRITEITQTWESGKTLIEATFGESSPSLLDQIKKAR